MQIPSSRSKGGLLNSVMLSIVGESEADVTLSIQSARTSQQIFQYHAELSHVFNELRDDIIKKKTKNSGTVESVNFMFNSPISQRIILHLFWMLTQKSLFDSAEQWGSGPVYLGKDL